jgi:hypothetical protein
MRQSFAYYKSDAFLKALAPETQRMRRNILERFRADNGGKGVATFERRHVVKLLEKKKGARSKEPAQDHSRLDAIYNR